MSEQHVISGPEALIVWQWALAIRSPTNGHDRFEWVGGNDPDADEKLRGVRDDMRNCLAQAAERYLSLRAGQQSDPTVATHTREDRLLAETRMHWTAREGWTITVTYS